MKKNKKPWDKFFEDKMRLIFSNAKTIVDIGGGLRISQDKGNRFDPSRSWLIPLAEKVDYKVLDPVNTYNPDIVGDIHNLPLADNSVDAILCIAVLEHIENPFLAVKEMHRALKPGGYCYVYVPFLYYYHAETGYYKDYWRYSRDALEILFKDFGTVEIQSVRGAIETWIKISPLGRFKWLLNLAYFLDKLTGKIKSKQVSGYGIFLVK